MRIVCYIFQFVFYLQVDSSLLNTSLLLVLTDWLVPVTELTDSDRVYWLLMIVWLNNIELID